MFYLRLFESLAKHEVRYLLVGGLPVNLHGIPRMTMDVDVVIALDAAYERRVVRDLDGVMISLAAIPDLIAMKRKSGRPQDDDDVEQLRKLIHE